MHPLHASHDVNPAGIHARDVGVLAGSSSFPARIPEGNNGMHESQSVAEICLSENLRVISNRRRTLGFPADVVTLREGCSRHGMRPEHVNEDAGCFDWMVDHLFSGRCIQVRDASIPGFGLYEDSACANVTLDMETEQQIVSHVLDCVLSRLTFFSTDSLRAIARVVARPSVNGNEDRRALLTILQAFRSTLVDHADGEDLASIFARFECLTKRTLTGMGVRHGVSVSGDRERLRDAVMFHLTSGDCTLSSTRFLHTLMLYAKDESLLRMRIS